MKSISFRYQNHRGEVAERTVYPIAIEFLRQPGFNYQPGWFLRGYCTERKGLRSFALSHILIESKEYFSLELATDPQ